MNTLLCRALSDQLYQTPHAHMAVRKLVTDHLLSHAKLYSAYVPGSYDDYCANMEQSGTWGDHITLQASLWPEPCACLVREWELQRSLHSPSSGCAGCGVLKSSADPAMTVQSFNFSLMTLHAHG